MRAFVVTLLSCCLMPFAYATLSNISLPNIPNTAFYKITDYNAEKSQRQTISLPYAITADGTGDLNINVTVTHPGVNGATTCSQDPQGNPFASCMENTEDGRQQVYYEIAYKPCGYFDQQPVSSDTSNSVNITLSNPGQYHQTSCQNDPALTQGRLVLIRLPFPRTIPSYNPTSGIYTANIEITTSSVI